MAIKKFNTIAGLSVGETASIDVIDDTGNITANNFTVTNESNLGTLDKVHILGGDPGQLITTDGAGNLTFTTLLLEPVGDNTQVQFNDAGLFGNSANFTFDLTSNTLTVDNVVAISITADGGNLSNIIGANVSGAVPAAFEATYATTANTVAGANVTGTVAIAADVTSSSQPNITSVGTLVSLDIIGNLTSGNADLGNTTLSNYFVGNGVGLTYITGGNVIGTVANANYAVWSLNTINSGSAETANFANVSNTVTSSSQPNITGLGDLTQLTVLGTSFMGNAEAGNVIANSLTSNSSLLVLGDATITGNLAVYGTAIYADVTSFRVEDPIIEQGGSPNGDPLLSNDEMDRGQLLHYYKDSPTDAPVDAFMGWDNSNAEFAFGSNVSVVDNIITFHEFSNIRANVFIGDGSGLTNLNPANIGVVGTATYATSAENVVASSQPNITSVGTLTTLAVTGNIASGNANLGNAATANYFIGSGANLTNITGANVTGTVANANYSIYAESVVASSQPNITSVGTLTTLVVTGNITSGNANLGNAATANFFIGSGANLFDITGANVLGIVANANYATYTGTADLANVAVKVSSSSQPNITSVGTLTSLIVTGNITSGNANLGNAATANFFIGSGANLFDIAGSNVSEVSNANFATYSSNANTASTVIASAQPNITSIGVLTEVTVSGNANIGNITTGIIEATGYISADRFIGNVESPGANRNIVFNAQGNLGASANITFDSDTNIFTVNGNISGYEITATYFSGDGSNLSAIDGGNVVGAVGSAVSATSADTANYANFAGNVISSSQPNITSVGTLTTLAVTGNITSGNANLGNAATANFFIGSGANLTSINGANVSEVANAIYAQDAGNTANATNAITVTSSSQPNITSLGTLTGVEISGNLTTSNATIDLDLLVSGNATINGNLTVNGTFDYINSSSLQIEDPIIQQGGGANGVALSTNDNKDRGSVLHYYTDETVDAFMGWDNSNSEFVLASNVSLASDVVTINHLGIVRAATFIGNLTGNITPPGSNTQLIFNDSSNLGASSKLTFNSSSNLLTIDGNITAGNVSATTFTGALIGAASTAGTVTASNQPNITHLGTLGNLDVTGNVTANWFIGNIVGNISGNFVVPGSNTEVLFNTDGNADASPNFVFDTATNVLTVIGNVDATVINATYLTGDGSNIASINGGNVSEVANANYATYAGSVPNADTAVVVTASSQPNITSVGTLTLLAVTGNISSGNASLGNLVTAAYFSGNGHYLDHLVAANIVGTIANANYSTYSGTAATANAVAGANVSGEVANANYATYSGHVIASSQSNITSVGTLLALDITGDLTVNNITVTSNVTVGNLLTASAFSGNGKLVTNVDAVTAVTATVAGHVTASSQANITSVGTLTDLTITGAIYSGDATLGNLATANFFGGNGSYLTSLTGAAVTGIVANATYSANAGNANHSVNADQADLANIATVAGHITASSQPNITSVGDLIELTIIGNIAASNGIFGNGVFASFFTGDGANLRLIQGANVEGSVANAVYADTANNSANAEMANIANVVSSSSQPNITSVGSLINLTVTGDTTLANITATKLTIGNIVLADSNITADNFTGNFVGNIFGNIEAPGTDTSVIFNNSGNISSSTAFQFDSGSNVVSITGNLSVSNVITRDSKIVPTFVSSISIPADPQKGDEWYDETNDKIYKYVFDGVTYAWVDITSGFISANAEAQASTLVLRDINASVTANIFYGNGINISGHSNLGSVSNIYISGGTSGYVLETDGNGNLTWIAPTTASGLVGGDNTQIQFNDGDAFAGNANLTFTKASGTLSVPYANLVLTTGASSQPNITSVGTQYDITVSNAAIITNVIANNIVSRNANVVVTTNSVIDSFAIGSYRTAKYTIKAGSDDGYQSVEVLLVHNDSSSFITIYGSISSTTDDIITITSNIVSGNVKLYASSASSNTKVKLIGTYVTD